MYIVNERYNKKDLF